MNRKIKITADSTCDLNEEMIKKFDVEIIPLHIVYDNESFEDGVNIFASDIIERYRTKKQLPKTAAVSMWEYTEHFKKYVDAGYDVIHISLGSSISSSHQNSVAVAAELGHVYPIDSQSLSSSSGLLVGKAYDFINETDLSAEEIADELKKIVPKTSCSFVIDSLEFLRAGGRCSTLAMLGANLLKIKPCIEVNNSDGASMTVGRKYRGKFESVITQYTREKLAQFSSFDTKRIALVSCSVSDEIIESVYNIIKELNVFEEICITNASCTITSHCGEGTLGIMFITK